MKLSLLAVVIASALSAIWPAVASLAVEHLAWIVGTPLALLVVWALRKWWPGVAAERQRQIATAARGASIIVGRVADDGQVDWKDHLATGLKALAEGLEAQGAPPLEPKEAKVAARELLITGVVPPAPLSAAAKAARERLLRQ